MTSPDRAAGGTGGAPFRFGIQLSGAISAARWREAAVRAEGIGYRTLLIPDHFGEQLAPMPALTAAAAVTTTLRLGTLVCDNDFRHSLVLAKDAATVDLLSDGRLELGLGAGWDIRDYRQTGIVFDPPARRVARMREAVAVIRAAWTGRRFDFAGEFYTVSGYTGSPRPAQPHLPLLIGSGSPGLLRFAAGHAEIVALAPRPVPDGSGLVWADMAAAVAARKADLVRQAAADRPGGVELSCNVFDVVITAHPAAAAARLAGQWRVPANVVAESPHVWIGTPDRIIDRLHRQREQYGLSYYTILGDPEIMAAAAPVVAALTGK